MGLHLPVVAVVVRELSVLVHQVVCHHIELQLLIFRVEHQIILLLRPGKSGAWGVDEGEDPGPDGAGLVHHLHHLLGVAGDGGVDHHRPLRKAPVAGGQELRRVLHVDRQGRAPPHIHLHLEAGCVGAADADEVDAVEALLPNFVDNCLDLGTESKGSVDAGERLRLVEAPQAGALGLLPRFCFIFHLCWSSFFR
jgi:hypothetical protein